MTGLPPTPRSPTGPDDDLVPWAVEKSHRRDYPLAMLRQESRRRSGLLVELAMSQPLDLWSAQMGVEDTVVHYDRDEGFSYVPRRPGVDLDLVRAPGAEPDDAVSADA